MICARIQKHFPVSRTSGSFTLDVDFAAGPGITAIFGPSGAGKTMTLESLAGFLLPGSGRILLDDEILFDGPAKVNLPPQRRRCGYVFQNYALFPHMTLRGNLAFAAGRLPKLERHRRISETLERFRLAASADRKPHEVSGGEKQRCSIARALIGDPRMLLLDEPSRGLDAPLRAELYETLLDVAASFRLPVLLVSHNLEECFELATNMLVMNAGRLVQTGAPSQIASAPANLDLAKLLAIYNILPAEIRALDPVRKSSVLRIDETEITGPYYPGHLKGDRVHLLATPRQLTAVPKLGRTPQNQIAAELERAADTPHGVELYFRGGIRVELPKQEFVDHKDAREWLIGFPPQALRIL